MRNVRSSRIKKGAACAVLATTMAVAGYGTAFAANIASSTEPAATPSTLLTTASVRAGSAGPDFLGITNTNYDFQPSHTAGAGDPYPYYNEDVKKGWGADLAKADQFNRLAVWGTGSNVNANPYYQNLLVNYLLDDDVTDGKGALPSGYVMATTYHSNKETSAWGDVTVNNIYADGIISQDLVFGANKYTNWNGDYSAYTQTKLKNENAVYTNNDSTNVWTQMYTIEQLAIAADNAVSAEDSTKTLRYGNATETAVKYEKAIKGQMLYVASQLDAEDGTTDGQITDENKKTVAYLYAIMDGTGYFFVPGTATEGSTDGNNTTATSIATADGDYVSNNSTINMGYMATLPFVTNTFDSGNALEGGIVMKVEDIWKANPACMVSTSMDNATEIMKDVDVIIYNSGNYTGYDEATEEGSSGTTMAGTNNGRNSSGIGNTDMLNDEVVSNWAKAFGFAGTTIAGDDYGTSTRQQTSFESAPILYCARNYTVDKDTRAAWAFSKVFPEYYDNNDDATYAYWLENIYHIQSDKVANTVAQMTHQSADNVAMYESNTKAVSDKAETGYDWYVTYGKTSYAADFQYYTGATRASWYAASSSALVDAAKSVGSEMTEDEAKAQSAELCAADVLASGVVGIFEPSQSWADSHEATVNVNGQVITASDIETNGTEVTLNKKGTPETHKGIKLADYVTTLPDEFCHLEITCTDGAYGKWYPTQAELDGIYIIVRDDGLLSTAVDQAEGGNMWAKGVTYITAVTEHSYVDGICTYCGAEDTYVTIEGTKVYRSYIEENGEEVTLNKKAEPQTNIGMKVSDLATLPDEFCHLEITCSDGAYTKWYPTQAELDGIYIIVRDDGLLSTAANQDDGGYMWAKDVTEIKAVTEHSYGEDHLCTYCGAEDAYVTIEGTKVYRSYIEANGTEVTLQKKGVAETNVGMKLSDLATLPDEFCHLEITCSDGAYTKWYPTQAELDGIYIIVRDDGLLSTAVDQAEGGNMWAKDVTEIKAVTEHSYVDGICEYCGVTLGAAMRLSGETRYDTMESVVFAGFNAAETAIVASGDNFPDALSASALAGAYDAPVVLTTKDSLSDQAKATLEALDVKNVIIIGGTAAVSDAAASAISGMGITVDRISGDTRQETAREVAKAVNTKVGAEAGCYVIATGKNFADALAIAPYAYANCCPILLCDNDGNLDAESAAMIPADAKVLICGGDAVVSTATEKMFANAERLAGSTRYETAEKIAAYELENGMTVGDCAVATGDNFPDALAGAALCGSKNSILVLANAADSPAIADLQSQAGEIGVCYFLGGTGAISDEVANSIVDKLGLSWLE